MWPLIDLAHVVLARYKLEGAWDERLEKHFGIKGKSTRKLPKDRGAAYAQESMTAFVCSSLSSHLLIGYKFGQERKSLCWKQAVISRKLNECCPQPPNLARELVKFLKDLARNDKLEEFCSTLRGWWTAGVTYDLKALSQKFEFQHTYSLGTISLHCPHLA